MGFEGLVGFGGTRGLLGLSGLGRFCQGAFSLVEVARCKNSLSS